MEDAIHTWIIIVQVVMCIIVHIYSCPKPSMASICVTCAMLFLISYNKSNKPVHPYACFLAPYLTIIMSCENIWGASAEIIGDQLRSRYLSIWGASTYRETSIISRALDKLQPQVFLSSSCMSQPSTREWGNIYTITTRRRRVRNEWEQLQHCFLDSEHHILKS